MLRWVLVFNTRSGEDYARQLHALGAILAIPDPARPGQYLVIRDVTRRPVVARPEDISEIQRIYWVDEKPDSVRSLSQALRLQPAPAHVAAFFPPELEEKLLKLELDRADGRTEDQIRETRFEIRRRDNTYEPYVTHQEYLR